jgi:hypothetical protein
LIEASIRQKSGQLLIVRFSDAIRFNENKKRIKYAVYPLAAIAVILLFNPSFFSSSSDRIIHFQKNYTYAPFSFVLENKSLKAFRNEDFTLKLDIERRSITDRCVPGTERLPLQINPRRIGRNFSYTFKNLQRNVAFSFDAAGYASDEYRITVNEKPSLLSFDVNLHYPSYLNKPSEGLSNVGNLSVPEGTTLSGILTHRLPNRCPSVLRTIRRCIKRRKVMASIFEIRAQFASLHNIRFQSKK